MSALDDDPYLAELLDFTNEELGDEKKVGAAASQASASASSAAAAASSGGAALAASSASSQLSPVKAPSYRSSDTHRETLKLLSQLSPSMAKLPSDSEVRTAFREIFPAAASVDDEDMDLDRVQRALEEHLDVADLGPRASVIEAEVQRWREEREKEAQSQRLSQGGLGLSQSLSQQSLGDDLLSQSQAQGNGGQGRKRKRVVVPGGKSELPLTLPKGLTSAAEGAKGGGKGPKSLLVELDERDKGQDLTGDSGAVGRVHVSKKRGMVLDLKGHQYLASMRRCPALLLVSVGEDEAKVEDVVENLCVLTHLRDHLQAMGGQVVKGDDGASDWAGGSDEEDYSRFTYGGDSDADAGAKTKKKAVSKKKPAKKSTGAGAGAKGGKGKWKGGGGGRKSAAGGAKKKQSGPKKVSLKALKPKGGKKKAKKGSDDDSEEESEESWSDPDDDSDSDFSV